MSLVLTPNIERPDDFYAALTEAQREMTDAEAAAMNARLVLVLANQIGDLALLEEAIGIAAR